ncbi:hypothetical protein, partial [Escherichia coli]|uniref:hypothetical protein n=1 Tax=Escherichia coli TaxID=562 RepID=UPI003F793464
MQEISIPPEASRTVRLTTAAELETALAENVLSRAQAGQCILWVRNTVRQAQETFRLVQSLGCEGGPPVALLHSRFPHFRR